MLSSQLTSAMEEAKTTSDEVRQASRRQTYMWAAPAFFAFLLLGFLITFLWQGKPDAAATTKEILVLIITGGLGWAAGRKSDD